MESKGFVLVGFFAFWLGACLAFIVNIDAENITILTAATVAGLLSYMTIIVSEENEKNKKERDSLDYIRMVCQSYQEDLIKLVMVMAYRTIDFKMLKEERKKLSEVVKKKHEENDRKGIDALEDEVNQVMEKVNNGVEESKEIIGKMQSLISKGEKLNTYLTICEKSFKENKLREMGGIKELVLELNNCVEIYARSNNPYADESFLSIEKGLVENIQNRNEDLKIALQRVMIQESSKIPERKKEVFIYICMVIFVCLGYLVSEGYKTA